MMPKLPPPPSILMPFQIDAVDRWAKDYARAVAEACAKIAVQYGAPEIANDIRRQAEEIGK